MPIATRNDPFKNFSVLVEIDGVASAGFTSGSGLAAQTEVIEYHTLEDPTRSYKFPGRVSYPNVMLERGLTADRSLWDWWRTIVTGSFERRTVGIILLDDDGNEALRWYLHNAWIARFEVSEFNASKSEVAIETIELAHERLELDA